MNTKARNLGFLFVIGGVTVAAASCREGMITETFDTQQTRDFSGIAEIGDAVVQPIELHVRATKWSGVPGVLML